MAMNYKAYLNINDQENTIKMLVPISSFSVVGGASRTINLNSTSDIRITSELEQARAYKNITLFMPPSKDHVDMEAAVKLTDCANKKKVFAMLFSLVKFSGRTIIEALDLMEFKATITKPPTVVASHLLMIEVSLPAASLGNYKRDNKGVLIAEQM